MYRYPINFKYLFFLKRVIALKLVGCLRQLKADVHIVSSLDEYVVLYCIMVLHYFCLF